MHPSYNQTYDDYDYVHDNAFFANTTARDRGYFIIAPDWVSERKGIMVTHYQWPADSWLVVDKLKSFTVKYFFYEWRKHSWDYEPSFKMKNRISDDWQV